MPRTANELELEAPPPGETIIRFRTVSRKTGLGNSSLYAMIADGKFPRPVKLSTRRVGWVLREVEDWLAARIAEREARARVIPRRKRGGADARG